METIDNINAQFGIALEESASALTKGGPGKWIEFGFRYLPNIN